MVLGPASISNGLLTIKGAGAIQVLATQAANGSYAIGTQTATFQVGPAALAIKANAVSRIYGTPNPSFTGSITGAVGNDALPESFVTTATQNSPVNTYDIVPSVAGAALGNYAVTATNGTLTVTQAAAGISIAPASATVTAGQSVTLVITVTSATTGTPTGTIMLQDNGAPVTTLTLVKGSATYSAVLPSGIAHHFAATYLGDTNFTAPATAAAAAVILSGTDNTFTASTSTQQAMPGSAVTYTLQLTPGVGSYPDSVTFSAQGLPSGFTASFSPSTVTVTGTPQIVQLTLQAPGTKVQIAAPTIGPTNPNASLTLAFAMLPLLGIRPLRRSHKPAGIWLAVFCAVTLGLVGIAGCASNPASATTQRQTQTYTINVTATSGTVQHQTTVTLNW